MIVRKYCKRKRGKQKSHAKGKNKKDLMEEFGKKERAGLVPMRDCLRSTVPAKSAP
jgi:hypothetical protein